MSRQDRSDGKTVRGSRKLPRGIVVPLLTPLEPSGGIDRRATACLVDYVIGGGVDGIFILGSTGEGDSLSFATQYRFAELVLSLAGGRLPLFLGAMHSSTEIVTDFVGGCPGVADFAAVVVGVPYYRFLHSDVEVLDHFQRVRDKTGRPVIVYNLPHPSSRVLTPELLLKLSETDGVVGYKDSSGQLDHFQELVSHGMNRDGFRMYQGDPALSLASLAIGSDGLIPGTANFIPHIFTELYQAFRVGDAETAARHQAEILRFRRFARVATPYHQGGFHFSTFKAGLEVMGFGGGTPAPPYQALPETFRPQIRAYFASSGVLTRISEVLQGQRPQAVPGGAPAAEPAASALPHSASRFVAEQGHTK